MGAEQQQQQPKLQVKIGSISGKNQKDQYVWGVPELVGFVRVEVKGGERPIQISTKKVALNSEQALVLDEEMDVDIPEGSKELRILLCYEKQLKGNKRAISVLAACGIYIQDIQDASPIEKTFQLYKPMQAGEGGTVEVFLNYVDKTIVPPPTIETPPPSQNGVVAEAKAVQPAQQQMQQPAKQQTTASAKSPRRLFTTNRVIIFGALVAAAIVGVTKLVVSKR